MKIIFLSLFFSLIAAGQQIDTVGILRSMELERQLDSLRVRLRTVDDEVKSMKVRMAEGTNIEELMNVLSGEEELENIPDDQRSKRKRVDALLRAITARPGQLRFNGGAVSILQWNRSFTTATGSLNLFAHTSIGGGTLLFFDFEAIGGNGPNAHVPTLTSVNADAGSTQSGDGIDRLNVNEAWVEFSALNEGITITAGKIDLTNYFDNNAVANDEASQFISAAFVNSAALPVPTSSPGIRIRSTLLSRFYVQVGLSNLTNTGDNIANNLFRIGSVGSKLIIDSEYEGNIRCYGYLHSFGKNNAGYGLSYDQNLCTDVTIFARWNRNEPAVARSIAVREAWSAGGRLSTHFENHRIVLSAAYGETIPQNQTLQTEQIIEVFVRYHINKWAQCSPHYQYVIHTEGIPADLSVLGFRIQFNF